MADQDSTLTQELLLSLFEYRDGELYWKKRNNKRAGCVNGENYRHIVINKKLYKEHRLIFMMFHGYMPEFIDHIDNNRLNNKIENLRQATKQQNAWNRQINKNNKSGVKGVSWCKLTKKWKVQGRVDKKVVYLGVYQTLEEAAKAIEKFRFINHGIFAKQ
jgi:hypothetical protein